jgi:carboxypeptidase Q
MSEGMNLTHTGLLGPNGHFAIPVISITAEDEQQLLRFLDRGRHVRLHINIQNGLMDEPVESANAVGEIQGTEQPEQIIVVGAHLDSWDLAQGSTDNGFGVACVLGAAEAIVRSGFKPKRTHPIRPLHWRRTMDARIVCLHEVSY